jgi:hypothetical protein
VSASKPSSARVARVLGAAEETNVEGVGHAVPNDPNRDPIVVSVHIGHAAVGSSWTDVAAWLVAGGVLVAAIAAAARWVRGHRVAVGTGPFGEEVAQVQVDMRQRLARGPRQHNRNAVGIQTIIRPTATLLAVVSVIATCVAVVEGQGLCGWVPPMTTVVHFWWLGFFCSGELPPTA